MHLNGIKPCCVTYPIDKIGKTSLDPTSIGLPDLDLCVCGQGL